MIKLSRKISNNSNGFIVPTVLMVIVVFSILMIGVASVINLTLGDAARNQSSQMALNIAEAGVNYYLWHVSHDNTDYKDGQSTPSTPVANLGYGPYVHR